MLCASACPPPCATRYRCPSSHGRASRPQSARARAFTLSTSPPRGRCVAWPAAGAARTARAHSPPPSLRSPRLARASPALASAAARAPRRAGHSPLLLRPAPPPPPPPCCRCAAEQRGRAWPRLATPAPGHCQPPPCRSCAPRSAQRPGVAACPAPTARPPPPCPFSSTSFSSRAPRLERRQRLAAALRCACTAAIKPAAVDKRCGCCAAPCPALHCTCGAGAAARSGRLRGCLSCPIKPAAVEKWERVLGTSSVNAFWERVLGMSFWEVGKKMGKGMNRPRRQGCCSCSALRRKCGCSCSALRSKCSCSAAPQVRLSVLLLLLPLLLRSPEEVPCCCCRAAA